MKRESIVVAIFDVGCKVFNGQRGNIFIKLKDKFPLGGLQRYLRMSRIGKAGTHKK
jgi:hypothetical protein